ncbi:enoyl-CoA hydratase [Aestuariivirga sp.]|uniref:enoyl-CoA hydratase n=1 Tax=Aestuariivirga sp. TaxID=2650926 RepID=UPI003918E05C
MSPPLLPSLEGGVLRLTLNDPGSRNSLSEAMMAALQEALDGAAGDRAVRVIVIAALGPAFCSGHNLKEISARRADPDRGAAYFAGLFDSCARLMLSIVKHPKPVIAEVAGLASAAGCQLVASCDLAVAAAGARFCTPGVNIGLFCSTPMVALSRNVAPKHAMEMLLTGDVFSAEEALRMGLVNRVVAENALSETVSQLAAKIASKSMVTLRTGKEAFYRQLDLPLDEAYAHTARVMTENLLQRDAEEGIAAFIGKRPPQWSDEP